MNEINENNNQEITLDNQELLEPNKPSKKMAIASMILGIISVIPLYYLFTTYFYLVWCLSTSSLIGSIIAFVCATLGMVFGILSLVRERTGIGMSIAGIVMSIIALPLGVSFILQGLSYYIRLLSYPSLG